LGRAGMAGIIRRYLTPDWPEAAAQPWVVSSIFPPLEDGFEDPKPATSGNEILAAK
jgi:hypothetical protein